MLKVGKIDDMENGLALDSFGGIYLAENATKPVAQKIEILKNSQSIGSHSVHVELIRMSDMTMICFKVAQIQ